LIRSNEEIDHLETHDDYVVLHLKSGKRIKSDAILWSNGRSGNTEGLNLEAIGLEANSRGQLKVDDTYCTGVENIYAAGDLVFFAREHGTGEIHHVGLYAGSGKMLHAPKPGEAVQLVSMTATGLAPEYAGARRFWQ